MRFLKQIAALVVTMIFVACGGGDNVTRPPAPVLTTIVVSLTPDTIQADQSAAGAAAGLEQNGAAIALGAVTWTTTDASIAMVSAGGFITAVSQGAVQIVATVGTVSGRATLIVTAVPVATVSVTPTGLRLAVGSTQQMTASVLDARGNVLTNRVVVWSTSDATKATVSSTGVVTAIANGAVAITATSEGRSGSAVVNIGPEPVGSVTVSPPTATLVIGTTAVFTATAVGLTGTVLSGRTFTWTSSNPSALSIVATGNVVTATAVTPGTATLTATSEGISGSAVVTIAPPPPACASDQALHLAVGDVRTLTPVQIASTCLGGDAFASEYVLIPFNGSTFPEDFARVAITGTNTSSILASTIASVKRGPAATRTRAAALVAGEIAFKNRERSQLASRLSAVQGRGVRAVPARRQLLTSVPTAPVVGAIYPLNADINSSCGPKQLHPARVVAVLAHTIVLIDTTAPAGGYSDAELLAFGTAFDTLGFPLDTLNFGAPTDIDGNGRVAIFFTTGVNVLPSPAGTLIAGLFAGRDLLMTSGAGACAGSNEGEMFYVPVPDPGMTLNTAYADKAFLSNTVAGVLVHEFQHLINAGRRIYVNNSPVAEEVWLNEGLSHIAEELLYYRMSGNSPRTNINGSVILSTAAQHAAYLAYMSDGNIQRLGTYLFAPEVNSPYSDVDELETRGAIWELLRYAADQKGGAERNTWFALVNSMTSGQANFAAVFGSFTNIVQAWAVAQFTDDAGLTVASQYTYPSWNFRSIYPIDDNFGAWPLAAATRALPSGTTTNIVVVAGGAGYIRFRVSAGVLAAVASSATPSTVSFTLVRTR